MCSRRVQRKNRDGDMGLTQRQKKASALTLR